MMYPFVTFPGKDDKHSETELTFSDIRTDEKGMETLAVYAETWSADHNDFDHLCVILPAYEIKSARGYSKEEVSKCIHLIRGSEGLIFRLARQGNGKHFPERSFIVTPREMDEMLKEMRAKEGSSIWK